MGGPLSLAFERRLLTAKLQSVENAQEFLVELPSPDRKPIVDGVLTWLESSEIAGYHGSRLTDEELDSVRKNGLLALNAGARRNRLARALSPHPDWPKVRARLDKEIRGYGPKAKAGQRQGQVHLALSRVDVASGGYRQILTQGSEFDQRVAFALLEHQGIALLARHGEYRVIKVRIPGDVALAAANPFGGVEHERSQGNIPNLAKQFLSSWCSRRVHPDFQVTARPMHCSMVFLRPVPADWIEDIDTLD